MKTHIYQTKLATDEKETHFWIDADKDDVVCMETTIMKDFNRAQKQGWKQTEQYLYADGSVVGGCFEAPRRCLSMRNIQGKVLTEEHLEKLANARKKKGASE